MAAHLILLNSIYEGGAKSLFEEGDRLFRRKRWAGDESTVELRSALNYVVWPSSH
jgi:hypothetical protein